MVMLYEHTDVNFIEDGVPVKLADLQDGQAVVIMNVYGEVMLTANTRIIEFDMSALDPYEAMTLDQLDELEQDLVNAIAWIETLPKNDDRDDMLDILNGWLDDDVPFAREMIPLEFEFDEVAV